MPTFYEFFAGAGLARLGLGENWACLWANDNDPKKQDVYTHNFGDGHFSSDDVARVNASSLPPCTDMAWASFPCTDLSLAGWQRGMLARNSGAFWAFWRIMRDLHDRGERPPLIVIENVVGLLNHDDFRGLCAALSALHMKFGAVVMDAERFLPQSRPRVFLVAVDADAQVEHLATKIPVDDPWVTKALLVAQARLPKELQRVWRWWQLPAPPSRALGLAKIIEDVPEDSNLWNSDEYTQRLLGMMTPKNAAKVAQPLLTGKAVGTLYRRMRDGVQRAEVRFDDVAGCLRTPRGGSSRQTLVIVTPNRVRSRLLTPREAARLMGVPDSFWLPDSYNDAYLAMGDAVAVPVVAWLSDHLLLPMHATIATDAKQDRRRLVSPKMTTIKRIAAHRKRAEKLAAKWEAVRV